MDVRTIARAPEANERPLLPDLSDDKVLEKAVNPKGRMSIDVKTHDIAEPLDGAEMSIEIKIDPLLTRRTALGRQ